jgi:ABC-2 type transport system permease protein
MRPALEYGSGFFTLLRKEIKRFYKVAFQTVAAPVLTAVLYLTSSSLIQSKITGNLVFILLAPLTHLEFYSAYVLAAVFRGIVVGLGVLIITLSFDIPSMQHPLWILLFAFLGAAILGGLGLIAGIWADKFDQLAAFQNFLIMPATMLSGVFYSIHSLPTIWQVISHFNPFFYMIDGFRYGFFGVSDVSPWLSLLVVGGFFMIVSGLALRLLQSGYKLRH